MDARRASPSILAVCCLLASALVATPADARDHRGRGFHHHHRHHHHHRGAVFLGFGFGCCGYPYYPPYYPPYYRSYYPPYYPPVYVEPLPPPVAPPPVAPQAPPPAASAPSDLYCREFSTPVIIDGTTLPAHGFACRQLDGSWKIVPSLPKQPG